MRPFVIKVKDLYDKGLYTRQQIDDMYSKGAFTLEEYRYILGEVN